MTTLNFGFVLWPALFLGFGWLLFQQQQILLIQMRTRAGAASVLGSPESRDPVPTIKG